MKLPRWSPSAWVGFVLLGSFVLFGAIGPWLAPHSPSLGVDAQRFATPSEAHWLGCDSSGIDTLSELLWGARKALYIAGTVVTISALIGVTLGDRKSVV